jgi:hypothetical protein
MTFLEDITKMAGKKILLSFDAEEFDIPEELFQKKGLKPEKILALSARLGAKISDKDKFGISRKGLERVLALLDKLRIRATFFTTSNFALHNKELIKKLSKKHEVASHGCNHCKLVEDDIKNSKRILEKITGKEVSAFRIPRFEKIDLRKIKKAGYKCDSSINPSYLPGRYHKFFSERRAHFINGLLEVPMGAMPVTRFPLSWIAFKVFPFMTFKLASGLTLNYDGYLNLCFHPWEFVDIGRFGLPWYVKRYSGEKMIKRLEKYLLWLKTRGEFITFSEFYSLFSGKSSADKNNRAPEKYR